MATSLPLPGGPLEICFSVDTTVSMTSYVDQVKARLQDMVQRLKSDIPGIKIALFAHGDYYQERFNNSSPYVTRHIDFTDDVTDLCTFINDSVPTNGGDWDECYELVMKKAREELTWTPGTNRVLVMLGDAKPHPFTYYEKYFPGGTKISWTEEADHLVRSDIRCYGVFCSTPNSGEKDKRFFRLLPERTMGSYLELKNFDSIFDFMMAICYREHGEDALFAYEAEVRKRTGGAVKDVHNMFTTLKKSVSNASTHGTNKTVNVSKTSKKSKIAPTGRQVKTSTTTNVKMTKAVGHGSTKTKASVNTSVKAKNANSPVTKPKAGRAQRGKRKIQSSSKTGQAEKRRKTSEAPVKWASSNKPSNISAKNPLPRLRRENVPETNFALRYFPWSSWKVVISSTSKDHLTPKFQTTGNKSKPIHVEYSVPTIFNGKTKCPALYEFAVKPQGRRRKKIVYVKFCSGFSSNDKQWYNILFPSMNLRKQVDNIVHKQGGEILVRRLILKKYRSYDAVPAAVQNYDYVWAPREGAKKYRELKCDSYVISEEMTVD